VNAASATHARQKGSLGTTGRTPSQPQSHFAETLQIPCVDNGSTRPHWFLQAIRHWNSCKHWSYLKLRDATRVRFPPPRLGRCRKLFLRPCFSRTPGQLPDNRLPPWSPHCPGSHLLERSVAQPHRRRAESVCMLACIRDQTDPSIAAATRLERRSPKPLLSIGPGRALREALRRNSLTTEATSARRHPGISDCPHWIAGRVDRWRGQGPSIRRARRCPLPPRLSARSARVR